MNEYLDLYITFAKIGSMMFGGGYSMLPLLTRELVENKKWTTNEELTDYFAISQCTPGVIAVNTATFIGNKRKGVTGGILATLGVITVPFFLIILIASLLSNVWQNPFIQKAFNGIRVAVAALIISSAYKLFKSNVKNKFGIVIFLAALLLRILFNVSTIIIVIVVALIGLFIYWRNRK